MTDKVTEEFESHISIEEPAFETGIDDIETGMDDIPANAGKRIPIWNAPKNLWELESFLGLDLRYTATEALEEIRTNPEIIREVENIEPLTIFYTTKGFAIILDAERGTKTAVPEAVVNEWVIDYYDRMNGTEKARENTHPHIEALMHDPNMVVDFVTHQDGIYVLTRFGSVIEYDAETDRTDVLFTTSRVKFDKGKRRNFIEIIPESADLGLAVEREDERDAAAHNRKYNHALNKRARQNKKNRTKDAALTRNQAKEHIFMHETDQLMRELAGKGFEPERDIETVHPILKGLEGANIDDCVRMITHMDGSNIYLRVDDRFLVSVNRETGEKHVYDARTMEEKRIYVRENVKKHSLPKEEGRNPLILRNNKDIEFALHNIAYGFQDFKDYKTTNTTAYAISDLEHVQHIREITYDTIEESRMKALDYANIVIERMAKEPQDHKQRQKNKNSVVTMPHIRARAAYAAGNNGNETYKQASDPQRTRLTQVEYVSPDNTSGAKLFRSLGLRF